MGIPDAPSLIQESHVRTGLSAWVVGTGKIKGCGRRPSLQCTPQRFLPLIEDYSDLQIPLVRMRA